MKYNIFFIPILLISFLSCAASKEMRSIRQAFLNAPSNFFNKDHLLRSRDLISKSLNETMLNNDSVIFIETFEVCHVSYRCFIYTSTNNTLIKCRMDGLYFRNNLNPQKLNFEKEDVTSPSNKRLIEYFKQNSLDKIKQKGDKANYTPSPDMIVTVIRRVDKKYMIDYIVSLYNPREFE